MIPNPDRIVAELARAGITARAREPLSAHTTFKIGGLVPVFVEPRGTDEVHRTVVVLGAAGLDFRTLGAGSNLLVDDDGLDFAVIATAGVDSPVEIAGSEVTLAAGLFLPRVARELAKHGLTGLEFAVGIPGSVGGAIRMNAGAWGSEMSRVVRVVKAICRGDGQLREIELEPGFSYRHSAIADDVIVTSVRLALEPGDPAHSLQIIEELLAERRQSQPTAAQSAGCAFANPTADSAGRLIDQAGLKGMAVGQAEVSTRHANFIVNRGGATAREVRALIAHVRERVRETSGVDLRQEIVEWRGSDVKDPA